MKKSSPTLVPFFEKGLKHGQVYSSKEVRTRGRELEKKHGLSKDLARDLARAIPKGSAADCWVKQPEEAVSAWQLGRDLYDIGLAAKHTAGIINSVKQLGRTEIDRTESFDINDSINQGLALLQSDLRRVSVQLYYDELPAFQGSQTELIQVWVNILKNACDAMKASESAKIEIHTRVSNNRIFVTIGNNGPEIDEATRRKIFQPDFTTKKTGLSFGLGLGLSIVKRIVSGYNGTIVVKSDSEKTIFRIKLATGVG